MIFRKEKPQNPDDFWREYEEKTGEKVLARSLGQYVSGWDEFEGQKGIWGLIIATSGGFRFHHFPQQSWLMALSQTVGREAPKEKTIFIPKEKIISAQLVEESIWWKKLLKASIPRLLIHYHDEAGDKRQLWLEANQIQGDLAGSLTTPQQ